MIYKIQIIPFKPSKDLFVMVNFQIIVHRKKNCTGKKGQAKENRC